MQKEYLILNENTMVALTEKVNRFLKLGWVTAGGICCQVNSTPFGSSNFQYLQAIVREK